MKNDGIVPTLHAIRNKMFLKRI